MRVLCGGAGGDGVGEVGEEGGEIGAARGWGGCAGRDCVGGGGGDGVFDYGRLVWYVLDGGGGIGRVWRGGGENGLTVVGSHCGVYGGNVMLAIVYVLLCSSS